MCFYQNYGYDLQEIYKHHFQNLFLRLQNFFKILQKIQDHDIQGLILRSSKRCIYCERKREKVCSISHNVYVDTWCLSVCNS